MKVALADVFASSLGDYPRPLDRHGHRVHRVHRHLHDAFWLSHSSLPFCQTQIPGSGEREQRQRHVHHSGEGPDDVS